MADPSLVLGLDFGTDSVRCIAVACENGRTLASAEARYPRWAEGRYCDVKISQFRQHPADHLESMKTVLKQVTSELGAAQSANIIGIGVDSTGSTPVAVDESAMPLSLSEEFFHEPATMFWLWKDHTATDEAEEISALCRSWGGTDYSQYCGGDYSPEWYWAKLLRFVRQSPRLVGKTASWVEHCDWIVSALIGNCDTSSIRRSRCAAGHKAMWHGNWMGWPDKKFLEILDPALSRIAASLPSESYTSDRVAGTISKKWSQETGLPDSVAVSIGILDAHAGAIGGGIRPGALLKVIGTSTCDMVVAKPDAEKPPISGIAGEVDGSIIPGYLGMEAGQSAFGDIYRWFQELLLWPIRNAGSAGVEGVEKVLPFLEEQILPRLDRVASESGSADIVAVDWWNGRRSPHVDMTLTGWLAGLRLGTRAPELYCSLVEATAFGARRIVEHLEANDIDINTVIAVGGIPKRSPFVMRTLANVLNRPVHVVDGDQVCALGSAICAATALGVFTGIESAQSLMAAKVSGAFEPESSVRDEMDKKYQAYIRLGETQEQFRR